ncbi:MAG: hypothetical protein RLZZ450_6430 [Pseudomonadota bacterium]|jgi:hypothetical protein
MKSWVDISIPGRHAERYRLADAGTTIGSSPSADITLTGATSILSVHCQLRPQPEGCWVELIESAPEPMRHEGQATRSCLVPWGHDVFLGSVRLTVAAELDRDARKGGSPVVWLAALAVPLLLGSFFLKPGAEASSIRKVAPRPPALFGGLPSCSEDKTGALGRAEVAEQLARAKYERGVFELGDLIGGVQLMREAGVCYALGENQGGADRAFDQMELWSTDVQFSYKRAQLDLEVASRDKRPREMLDAIARLRTLLAHAGNDAQPYLAFLDQKRREQLAVLSQRTGKKKR